MVFDAQKSELDSLIINLKLPSSSRDYAMNIAVNRIIQDSMNITEHDIFLVTIYSHLILGYNREAVYYFQDNKWKYLKDESDIVRYYSSCSQNYWIAQKYDSLKNKSEIRVNTFFDKTYK